MRVLYLTNNRHPLAPRLLHHRGPRSTTDTHTTQHAGHRCLAHTTSAHRQHSAPRLGSVSCAPHSLAAPPTQAPERAAAGGSLRSEVTFGPPRQAGDAPRTPGAHHHCDAAGHGILFSIDIHCSSKTPHLFFGTEEDASTCPQAPLSPFVAPLPLVCDCSVSHTHSLPQCTPTHLRESKAHKASPTLPKVPPRQGLTTNRRRPSPKRTQACSKTRSPLRWQRLEDSPANWADPWHLSVSGDAVPRFLARPLLEDSSGQTLDKLYSRRSRRESA